MEKHRFGTFLCLLRKEKGLTQRELAEELGVTDKAVSRWEKGKNYPDIEIVQRIAEFFDVSINELLQGERIPEEYMKAASDRNLVVAHKRIRREQRKYTVAIAALLLFVLLWGIVCYTPAGSMVRGIKETKLEVTSHDAAVILSCIDGYMTSQTGDSVILDDPFILLHGDKTIEYMDLLGKTRKGDSFRCSVQTVDDIFPMVYVSQDKEPSPVHSGITLTDMEEIVKSIDFSLIDDDFSAQARYEITVEGPIEEECTYTMADGKKAYTYDRKNQGFQQIAKDARIKAPCIRVSVFKYDKDGKGSSLAHIFW